MCGILVMKNGKHAHNEGIKRLTTEKIKEIDVENG